MALGIGVERLQLPQDLHLVHADLGEHVFAALRLAEVSVGNGLTSTLLTAQKCQSPNDSLDFSNPTMLG